MKKILSSLLILATLFSFEVLAEEVPLWLNYKLPESTDLKYEARRLEANALSQRNIEVQACANGKNNLLCENNAEVAFRRRILAIPQARFRLYYSELGTTAKWLLDLSAAEVTDSQLNQSYKHLGPETSEFLGISIETSDCSLLNSETRRSVSYYNPRFNQVVCQMVVGKTDATLLMWKMGFDKDLRRRFGSYADFLLNHGAEANVGNPDKVSILMVASSNGDTEIAKLLVSHGAEVNARANDGDTALLKAARNGKVEVSKFLVDNTADIFAKNEFQEMALGQAALAGAFELVRVLISMGAEADSLQDDRSWTALMFAAYSGSANIVEYLIGQGANVNASDKYIGINSLMLAAKNGHIEAVKVMLSHGVTLNSKCSEGTALTMAEAAGQKEMVNLLQQHGGTN